MKQAKRLYDDLFGINGSNIEIMNADGGRVYNIFDHVATTNYDLVLENYSNESPERNYYSTQRGFKEIPKGIGYYLDLPSLRQQYPKWKRDDAKIVLSNSGDQLYGKELVEHIMIYPIYEKYISLEPFYSLYTAFRNMLRNQELVVIIGYSFRDISVNNAFIDYLRLNHKARLILSAKSNSVKERISRIFGDNNRVRLIENYFGEQHFITDLENELTSK